MKIYQKFSHALNFLVEIKSVPSIIKLKIECNFYNLYVSDFMVTAGNRIDI